jgi:hypothetical protein
MRVITYFFSIESRRLALGHPVDGALDDSTPTTVKDVINNYREWLGMHEGENRIALMDRSILYRRPTRKTPLLKVFFSSRLIEAATKTRPTNER